MRTIKFRAWDKEYEKMTYFDDEDYEYKPPLVFRLDQVFKKNSNYDDYEDFEYNDITDKVEVMQFTGLHDKNGKEIYEGDILQIDIERAWVMWNEKYGYFELVPIGDYYFDSDVIGQAIEYTDATVIGNIYENEELLNETNR